MIGQDIIHITLNEMDFKIIAHFLKKRNSTNMTNCTYKVLKNLLQSIKFDRERYILSDCKNPSLNTSLVRV